MKYIKTKIFAAIAVGAILACGSSSSDNEEPYVGQTYRQAVTLPATQADTVVTLSDLKSAIGSIEGGEAWLTVTKQPYTSGAPNVRLTATVNENDEPRSSVVTVTATSTDKVLLTVTQQKAEPQEPEQPTTDDGDLHDVVTDQPAASR